MKRKLSQANRIIVLKDALFSLSPRSGSNLDYGKAMVVGCVAGRMSTGETFVEAWKVVRQCLPEDGNIDCIPVSWLEEEERCARKEAQDAKLEADVESYIRSHPVGIIEQINDMWMYQLEKDGELDDVTIEELERINNYLDRIIQSIKEDKE